MARAVALWTIFVSFAAVTRTAYGIKARCDSGTRVFSLTAWHDDRLEGFDMTCTGGDDEIRIPEALDEEGGGMATADICSGTAGIARIDWEKTPALEEAAGEGVVVNVVVTCEDGTTSEMLATGHDFVDGDTVERAAACETGKYVQGIEYLMVQPGRRLFSTFDDDLDDITDGTIDDSFPSPTPSPTSGSRGLPSPSWTTDDDSRSVYYYVDDDFDGDDVQQPASSPTGSEDDAETPTGDVGDGSSTYFITSIAVVCSAAALDAVCSASVCSDKTSLKEEQPEYCQLAVCSQDECCEGNESHTTEITIGIVSSVAAAAILGVAAWAYNKYKCK